MESVLDQYDNTLLGILQNEGQILPFLDVIFGFLYRRTDFYRINRSPTGKLGFPEGVAENLVSKVFKKYQQLAIRDDQKEQQKEKKTAEKTTKLPPVAGTVEVNISPPIEHLSIADEKSKPPSAEAASKSLCDTDSYNGAIYDNYRWSQTITDADVKVNVPKHLTKAKNIKVDIGHNHLKVAILVEDSEWRTLVDDDLSWKINLEESMWTLVPGEYVHICMEKVEERWWESIFTVEPKINVQDIDASRSMEDLPDDEQAEIQRLMYNEHQKRLGLPTTDQMKIQGLLEEAWNVEGSPFKGQPFDPSIVNICNSSS